MNGLAALKEQDDDRASSDGLASEESSSGSSSDESTIERSKSVLFGRIREEYKFGLPELKALNSMTMLSAWHSIGLWLSCCILMCEVLQKLLKGSVQWMRVVIQGQGTIPTHILLYLATQLRSWFVVLCYADLARFCYWLGRDAWRADAFEAYRRAVVGLGEVEMSSGELFYDENGMPRGWPANGLTRKQKIVDYCMQAFIYVSFDVIPFVFALKDYFTYAYGNSAPMGTYFATLTAMAGTVGLVHATIFKFAWTYTDVRLKYKGLKKALAQGSWGRPDGGEEASEDGVEGIEDMPEVASPMMTEKDDGDGRHARPRGISTASNVLTQEMHETLKQRVRVATDQNLCVRICRVTHFVTPHVFWIGLLSVGLVCQRPLIILLSVAFAAYRFGKGAITVAKASGSLPTADKKCPCLKGQRHRANLVWALQAWGESCCGLDYKTQLQRRVAFLIMVGLQALLFSFLNWWGYLAVCTSLVLLQMMQLTVYCQVPWGWLVSLIEAGLIFVATTLLSVTTLPRRKQALETILFVIAHQCGLARKSYHGADGYKVVQISFVVLFTALTLVLAATTLTVQSQQEATDEYSMICKNCTYYRVPFMSPQYATGLACPAWFHLGNRNLKLSLSDFGLMSAIAYESNETIHSALELFFPGWSILHSKRVDKADRDSDDWTTFFEFAKDKTSVFVVRGTSTALDALNDMIIWMPAAVMQGFNGLGPDMPSPVARSIGRLSEIFGHLDNSNYRELQRYVQHKMMSEPGREYYITGHSLGGGLAKIVSLKALVLGLELPAVTFMSPGLQATQYLVETHIWGGSVNGEVTQSYLRDNQLAVTVMPENDIVSRIDTQTGQTVPIGCAGSTPVTCHLMGQGLCQIFEECGSGRKDQELLIPCGLCGEPTECIDGVHRKTFKTKRYEILKEEEVRKEHAKEHNKG